MPLKTLLLLCLCVMSVSCQSVDVSPSVRPEYGYPAGLIPHCPGTLNEATISPRSMPRVQVVLHQMKDGQMSRKPMPVLAAPRMLAKDKRLDLRNKKTVLYAVGFLDSSIWPHTLAVARSYAKLGYNVLVTETFSFLTYIYPKSVRLTRTIGKIMGQFLVKLYNQGLPPENLELVGLSLGAHIVSYAAKHFYNTTGFKPGRLTALDPSGPCFKSLSPDHKVHRSDAEKVDVFHTNIDGFGTPEPSGHIDYYVNGGEYQPGDIPYIPCLVVCSHIKSVIYWWQALENPGKFIAQKCDSVQDARYARCFNTTETVAAGLDSDFSKPGLYYLATDYKFPYFKGADGLQPQNEVYTSFIRQLNAADLIA